MKAFSTKYWKDNGAKVGIVDEYSTYILTHHTLMLDSNLNDPGAKKISLEDL